MTKKSAKPKTPTEAPQVKYLDKKLFVISGVLFGGLVLAIFVFSTPQARLPEQHYLKTVPVTKTPKQETITYVGQEGIDALTLLKKQASVTLDQSGLVIGINGERADSKKHEYWEFFVNGKSSDVGPKSYITEKGDMLTWKIATY